MHVCSKMKAVCVTLCLIPLPLFHGPRIPLTAISIGLWANKEVCCHDNLTACLPVMLHGAPHQPVVGVVYNFVTDELFAAQKGKGATVNSEPLHVSQCTGEYVYACMCVAFTPSSLVNLSSLVNPVC